MAISDYLLYRLAKIWPSPTKEKDDALGGEVGSEEFQQKYAYAQFDGKVCKGNLISVRGKDVLEIGCGHGGISCYIAAIGAKSVVGIDLNVPHFKYGEVLAEQLGGCQRLNLRFVEMNAYEMTFPPESFDIVVAENAFEHFSEPETVMQQSFRVLRPGGRLLVPIFSSIYSKYGLHLKHGLKLPWANLLWSEKSILRALQRMANDNPRINEWYPGLPHAPQRVRDVRRHKDLNDITYKSFKQMAARTGFELEWFAPMPTRVGKIVQRIPLIKRTILGDVFSVGAAACLQKPRNS